MLFFPQKDLGLHNQAVMLSLGIPILRPKHKGGPWVKWQPPDSALKSIVIELFERR